MNYNYLVKWWKFTCERFDPLSHFIMITLFFGAHYFVADAIGTVTFTSIYSLLLFLGTAFFFFKLRLYDEIKDYQTDLIHNPTRPLPRGLLKISDMKFGIKLCLALELLFFAVCSTQGVLGIVIAIGYSLLMYKEFFIGDLIGPRLTTYALTHTVVTVFLSLAIFSSFSHHYIWEQRADFYYFSILSWSLFNIFEFGRKVYQPSEEKVEIDTYSKVWGKWGAVLLVLTQAIGAAYLTLSISTINNSFMLPFQIFCLGVLLIASIIYLKGSTKTSSKLFRKFSEIYIALIYTGIITNYLLIKFYWTII